jgi:hypothetical protein
VWLDEEEPHFVIVGLLIGRFAGGIDRFLIAMPDHADFWDFVVQISLRANSYDRVVIDGVPIGGRAGPSIGFVVAGCLTTTWNGCWVLEASMELKIDRRRAPLFLFLSRVIKIIIFNRHEWQHSGQELDARQKFLIVYPRRHEFTRMNLNASLLPGAPLSTVGRQIFRVWTKGM